MKNRLDRCSMPVKKLLSGIFISVFFMILDGITLALLPVLNISYGGFIEGIAALIFLRGFLTFIGWLILAGIPAFLPWKKVRRPPLILAGIHSLVFALLVYGFCIEPMYLTVTRLEVEAPGISRPVRIVQLSDIHVERTTRRERAIPGLVASLSPDMIVITGDFPNESYINDPISKRDLRTLIGQLHAPLGVYGVNGNVDVPSKDHDLLDGLNIRLLNNEMIRLPQVGDHLVILGLDCIRDSHDRRELEELMKAVQPDDYSVLLYHKPDLAFTARDLGIDLYLAGHTHGGQVRVPFYGAIVTNSRYGKLFEMGRYKLGEMTLFVSRGLGFTGGGAPRIRFLAPPEIVVIDLVPDV